MERNTTLEAIEQYIISYQQLQQAQEPSAFLTVFFIAMAVFAGVGIVASVRFVYKFVKNGFKIRQPITVTRYVFVDSVYGVMFIAFVLSFIALFIVRAIAAGREGV
ncbi:MAG: hypothetical protein LBT81_00605 [Helicobacteraceae bacterium]|jgi:hypothetical protein|nr:hypothetical protein [Helicobacteraceae bacterium]